MWQYNNYTELYHHGILGQKWGVRRYQNPDGSLTEAGKERYGRLEKKEQRQLDRKIKKTKSKVIKAINKKYRSYQREEGDLISEYHEKMKTNAAPDSDYAKGDPSTKIELGRLYASAIMQAKYGFGTVSMYQIQKAYKQAVSDAAVEGSKTAGLIGAALNAGVAAVKESKIRSLRMDQLAYYMHENNIGPGVSSPKKIEIEVKS